MVLPFCTQCGRQAEPDQAFCAGCGFSLKGQNSQVGEPGLPNKGGEGGILEPDEKMVYQCTGAKLWAKESYGNLAARSIGSSLDKQRLDWDAGYQRMSRARYSQRLSEIRNQYAPPNLPHQRADVLLITDRRVTMVEGGEVPFELVIDPTWLQQDLEAIRITNENAVKEWNSAVSEKRKDGLLKTFARQYSRSAREELDIHRFGAVFHYYALLSAESKGRLAGGKELELKLDVLNLAKQIEQLSGYNKWIFGIESRGMKVNIRSYGLRFKEQEKTDDIAKFLQDRAKAISPIIAPYRK